MKDPSILVVEDDAACALYLQAVILNESHDVRIASDGTQALIAMESSVPEVVFLDKSLPDIDGLELMSMIRQRWCGLPVIFVTAAEEVPTVVEAVRRGATNYLVKPVAPAVLLTSLRKALLSRPDESRPRNPGLPELVGTSTAIVKVRHLVTLVAQSDMNVMITGETGTGKEIVARAIHRLSSLSDRPFVVHNCATTPPEIFDSEFFGHRRGAFTGADCDTIGLLGRARDGILFLDELESLGLPQQAKLLRCMDDGELRPVGSCESQRVSVRFLSATNCDPQELMEQGRLREDLYYRLRGFEVRLPPLRERLGDIPALVAHFLADSGHSVTEEALSALARSAWPGNVRQLRNVIHGASALVRDGTIDLPHVMTDPGGVPNGVPQNRGRSFGASDKNQSLTEMERQAILSALADAGGNRSRAARTLGIDRSTLRRKISDTSARPKTE